TIVSRLPVELPAAIFVIIHTSPREKSFLPEILNGKGGLPVATAKEGDRIEPGRIYVAPPDRHLMIAENHIHVRRGPKEGLHRPSINVTFRSAAMRYGPKVIGVLLSGMLDDGAAGLWDIGNRGGVTIVQDPSEAQFPSMPLNALRDVYIDYRLTAANIADILPWLVSGEETPDKEEAMSSDVHYDRFSGFTCPECHGPLYENTGPGPVEFRCRVGHILSLKTLLDEHTSAQERKLYEAILALEEGADLAMYTATRVDQAQQESLKREAEQLRRHAGAIKKLLEEREMTTVE
ncbi:MAG: chemotaxis protein CheB, partial [Acidobacteriaceae bacterium]|nr:chemotaxis protein CheB [Acidobacteriaceae bacterium]